MRLRPRRLLVLCGIALLTLPTGTIAADNPPVGQLIEQLGSSDFAERESAGRALLEAGEPALPALRQAAGSSDPEVRRRAAELARHVEKAAEAARLLAPKRVRLAYRGTPVPQALADFCRRTGYAIPLEGDTSKLQERRLTFDSGPVSFWEAFDLFCRQAGVVEPGLLPEVPRRRPTNPYSQPYVTNQGVVISSYPYYNPYSNDPNAGRLALTAGAPPQLPTCVVGAVRVRALPAHVPMPTVPLGNEERLLALEVTAQPDVAWQGVLGVHITRAVDERGRRLTQPIPYVGSPTGNEQQHGLIRVWNGAGYTVSPEPDDPRHIPVRLTVGPGGSRQVKELEGILTVQVQTPQEPLLRVDDLTRSSGQAVPGPHGGWLKVLALERGPTGEVKVHGQISYPPSDEAPPAWMTNQFNPAMGRVMFFMAGNGNPAEVPNLELRDSRGLPFVRLEQQNGMTPVVTDPRPRDFRLTFQPRPGQTEPAQLTYVGRRTLILEVPFSLKDVTLR